MKKSFGGPCLVTIHGEEAEPTLTLFDASHRQYQSRDLLDIAYKYIHECHGDWLLLQDSSDTNLCFLLNVESMEKVELPSLEAPPEYILCNTHFLMSDSRVFLLTDVGILRFCKIGANKFTTQHLNEDGDGLIATAAIIFQGKLYTLAQTYDLFCAELEHTESSPLQITNLIAGKDQLWDLLLFTDYCYTLLVESRDQLLLVAGYRLGPAAMDFQIFRADLENKWWEEVNRIGDDRAIFVDSRIGFSAPVTAGSELRGDCIYFVQDRDDHATTYAYDLEDQSITTLSPLPFNLKAIPYMRWAYID